MAAVLNSNIASLWASKNLQGAQTKMADSVERLSSGLRINRARDDAAGLGIANALTQQINGANQGVRNLNDGISMVQTAEGAISAAQEMAQRILTLATQGANGTMGTTDRTAIKNEMSQLLSAINSIGSRTKFSGNDLLGVNPKASVVADKYALQVSNITTDTISLSSNAFKSIGGFSASVSQSSVLAATGVNTESTITLSSTSGLTVGMSVSGTGIGTNARISAVTSGTVLTLTVANSATVSSNVTFGGGQTSASVDTTMSLASGTNPPQNLVGKSVYKVTSESPQSYVSIGTVKSISGNNITFGTGSLVNWNNSESIVFEGQLSEVLSATTSDLSLAQSIGSTTNDAANFQMVQRASAGYITSLSTQRSLLGAYQNQIEFTVSNVTELSANLSAARSNVQDTDYASETASLTKGQILQQAATAMLAQANQMPNVILSLLK